MTTYVPLTSIRAAPFQFQAVLDGTQYNVIVNWNVTAQRRYVNIYTSANALVLCVALIGSPPTVPIQSITWSNGTVTVTTTTPHMWNLLGTCTVTITGCVPTAYNGVVSVFVTSRTTFTFPLIVNPGLVTTLGVAAYNLSMTVGYFASTLVYREATQQFEITP